MKKNLEHVLGLALLVDLSFCPFLHATSPILTVFSDVGNSGNSTACGGGSICTWDSGSPTFNGSYQDSSAPEGYMSFLTISNGGYAGWGIENASPGQDFSAYANGELRFWAKSNSGNVQIQVQNNSGTDIINTTLSGLGWTTSVNNEWVEYRIPLTGLTLTQITLPFMATANVSGVTFYIDFVRWVEPGISSPYFNVTLKTITNNSAASSISWTNPVAGSGWTVASQYIQVDLDPDTGTGWGLQIYTDNKASDQSPYQYTGSTTTDPSGLVDTSTTTDTLPLAWSVFNATATYSVTSGTTTTTTTIPPVAANPNDNGQYGNPTNPNAFQWLYMKDRATPSIPTAIPPVTLFYDGDPFIAVKNNLGIHYVQGNTLNTADFGASNSPSYIYLEANFANALTQTTGRVYRTNTLRLEYYHE